MTSGSTSIALKQLRAVEYVRMSTDRQQLSIGYQQAAIRIFAAQRGCTVIRTYADEGVSGLYLEGRDALTRLLQDAESPQRDFDEILVYDVSRWGRFQQVDEAAYYEFRCHRAGVALHYCAEPFEGTYGPINAVLKAIKRAMAAEYSRELAVKTGASQARAVSLGYFAGGMPGYGLRRVLVDTKGNKIRWLLKGESKAIRSERVLLAPGPAEEVDVVRRIFELRTSGHMMVARIARLLNSEGVPYNNGRPWDPEAIRFILRNERYVGVIVYDRTTSYLRLGRTGHGCVKNDPSKWVRGLAGFDPIVPPGVFALANTPSVKPKSWYRSDEALLAPLRKLLSEKGYLSVRLVDGAPGLPAPQTYRKRFGSMREAYSRIGYKIVVSSTGAFNYASNLRKIKKIASAIATEAKKIDAPITRIRRIRQLIFGNGVCVRIGFARYVPKRQGGNPRWVMDTLRAHTADFVLAIKLDVDGRRLRNCYLLPAAAIGKQDTIFDGRNLLEEFRCKSLKGAIEVAASLGTKSAKS